MFEYMNYNALIFFGVFFVFPILLFKVKEPLMILSVVVLIGLIFWDAYNSYTTAQESKAYFKGGTSLKCISGGGLYSSANEYRVSKKNGWKMEGDYFIKDSLMIRANKCEKL